MTDNTLIYPWPVALKVNYLCNLYLLKKVGKKTEKLEVFVQMSSTEAIAPQVESRGVDECHLVADEHPRHAEGTPLLKTFCFTINAKFQAAFNIFRRNFDFSKLAARFM